MQGYSLEGLRDICEKIRDESEQVLEGYYIDDTISELFKLIYEGYPANEEAYQKALLQDSLHDVFMIEPLKAHIFDPEYTKLITKARLRNSTMLQIIDLMSISKPGGKKERRGRISYSALGINQMGAVYEALLSYRGFIAEETLFEVKRAGDKFNELDVGYFVPEKDLVNYSEDERVYYEKGEMEGKLRKYEKGTFIYRLAGREREKSASYYTPEVLTKCLVKYALKELLKDKTADEILNLTVCEPAMGSAAFLNEAINQLAEAYLNKKQEELGDTIPYDKRFEELQRVKMYIADRNVYGVDLNHIAVELAEVSLWLNTIYQGAYVPWFGTQLVCGNSLIGARRQVYPTSKLQKGKWYEEAPERIMPGDKRKKQGTSRVYHFLMGDPGMANYTDKVIKQLEPENIKKINEWRKGFNEKYEEEDIKTLLRLSDTIDVLWEKTSGLRQYVKHATAEPLSVYGHQEVDISTHRTIREKDEILHRIYKSEGGENASPYARLKCAMDYWCALWFWPIDKADLLPTRQEFLFDLALILEGGIASVSTRSIGQMSLIDDSGNFANTAMGNTQFFTEGSQIALKIKSQYEDLGVVNLDDLRKRNERLSLANQIANKQKFLHWELEFSDLFDEKKGFDLIVGNPPWIRVEWNQKSLLADINPIIYIKSLDDQNMNHLVEVILSNYNYRGIFYSEYIDILGIQNFVGAVANYPVIEGSVNLYKCFLPKASQIGNDNVVFSFIHPDGIYDDPKGKRLRKFLYPKLRYHFQFENEKKLFYEVHNTTIYSINIYSNNETENFYSISNLFLPETIEDCFDNSLISNDVPGIKDSNGNWSIKGHPNRMLVISENELKLFSQIIDGERDGASGRLLSIHEKSLLCALECFVSHKKTLIDLGDDIFHTMMWNETTAKKDKIINRNTHFPDNEYEMFYSGSLIGVSNPVYQTAKRVCNTNRSYDLVNLQWIDESYLQRCNYYFNNKIEEYIQKVPYTGWHCKYTECYKVLSRLMVGSSSERTLMTAIGIKNSSHIDTIFGIAFKKIEFVPLITGLFSTIPYDYYVKITKKRHIRWDIISNLPIPLCDPKITNAIIIRSMLLNCVNSFYKELWSDIFNRISTNDTWAKKDDRLTPFLFSQLKNEWNNNSFAKNDFERRELLIELDVLVSMALGLNVHQLIYMYKIQFPVLKQYEDSTWYDANGNIVFTTKDRGYLSTDSKTWNKNKDDKSFNVNVIDDTVPDGPKERTIKYIAPFERCDREKDYEEVWQNFAERFNI